jgi:chaperonin GroES
MRVPTGAKGHGTRDDVSVRTRFRIQANYLIPRKVRSAVSVSIKPLEDRILVRTLEAEQTTASGLVIPDTAKEKPQEGEVLAVGPGRVDDSGNRVPLDITVGDKVIYSKYGGTEVKYSGEEYLILSARDVLAVVDK